MSQIPSPPAPAEADSAPFNLFMWFEAGQVTNRRNSYQQSGSLVRYLGTPLYRGSA